MDGDGVSTGAALALRARAHDAPFALGATPRTWGHLLADAGAVARALPRPAEARGPAVEAEAEIMVACADRYLAAVVLLAAWDAGWVAAHPPNGSQKTIDELCAARGISLVVHDGGGEGGVDVRTLLDDAAGARGEPLAVPAFAPERVLVAVYTSGSTGTHVACRKTAAQILGEARLLSELFGLGPGLRLLATVPPHHIYGLLFGVLVPLMGGGAVVRGTPHHAEAIAEQATAHGVNVLCTVPAHLHGLGVLPPGAMRSFARVFSSGAPLAERTAEQVSSLLGTTVTEIYGSSETGGIAWRQAGSGRPWQPLPGVEVLAARDGTIVVRSPFAARGGASDGELPRFEGADLVRLHPDGGFDLLGRADGVVKIGGSRTSTVEVQQRLLDVPGVRDAAVITVDVSGPRQHELWAAVVAPGLAAADIRAALARWVDPIALPRRFRLVDALPREENGKLVRERLRRLFEHPSGTLEGFPNPPAMGSAGRSPSAPEHPSGTLEGFPNPPAMGSAGRSPSAPDAMGEAGDAGDAGDAGETAADANRQRIEVRIPADSPFFRGHFDDFPVLPGVVQVNHLVLRHVRARWPVLQHLRRVVGLKFKSPIRPGDTLAVELTRSTKSRVEFQILGAGGKVSSGTLVFDLEG